MERKVDGGREREIERNGKVLGERKRYRERWTGRKRGR